MTGGTEPRGTKQSGALIIFKRLHFRTPIEKYSLDSDKLSRLTRQLFTRLRKALRILCKILFNYLTCVKIKTYNEAFIVKDAVMLNVKLEQICNDVICNIFKLRVRPQLLLSSPGPKPLAPKTLKPKTKGLWADTKILCSVRTSSILLVASISKCQHSG